MNVLITGASRGLGLECVKQYAENGATVYACCREPGRAQDLERISDAAGGKISVHALDVAAPQSVDTLARAFDGQPLDIVINNAGVYGPAAQSADDMDYAGWAETLAVNVMAPFRIAQAFKKNLMAGRERKLIAITSSMGAMDDHDGTTFAYRSSKAALNNAMHGLAKAWRRDRLIVALIHPGWVKTDMGGPSAPLSPHQSIAGVRRVIAKLGQADSGKFFDYTGKELAW